MKRNLKSNYAKAMVAFLAVTLSTTAVAPSVFANDVISNEANVSNSDNVRLEYYQGRSVYLYFDNELDASSLLDTETGELVQTGERIDNKGFTLKINGEEAKVRNISDISIGDKNNDDKKTNVIALTLEFVPKFESTYTISYDSTKGNLKYKNGTEVQSFSLDLDRNSGVNVDNSGNLEDSNNSNDSTTSSDSVNADTSVSTDVNTENVRVEYYQGRSVYLYFNKELDPSSISDAQTGELVGTNEKITNKGFSLKINNQEQSQKTITDVSIGDKNNDQTKTDVIALTLEFVPSFTEGTTYTISYDKEKGNLKYKDGKEVESFSLKLDKNSGVNTDGSNGAEDSTQPSLPEIPAETPAETPVVPAPPAEDTPSGTTPVAPEVPAKQENVRIDYHQGRTVYLYFDEKIKIDGIKNQQDSEFFTDGFRLLKNGASYGYRTISDVAVGDTYNDKTKTNVIALTLDFVPSFNDKYSIEYDSTKGNLVYENGTKVNSFKLEFTKNSGINTGNNGNQGSTGGNTGTVTPPSTDQPSAPTEEVKVRVDYCRGKSVYLYFDKPLKVSSVSSREIGEYTDGFRLTKKGVTFDKTVNDVSVGDTYNDGIKTNVIALTLEFAPSFENPYTLEYNSEKGKLEFADGEKVGSFKLTLDKNTGVNTDGSGSVVIPPVTEPTPAPSPAPSPSPSPEQPSVPEKPVTPEKPSVPEKPDGSGSTGTGQDKPQGPSEGGSNGGGSSSGGSSGGGSSSGGSSGGGSSSGGSSGGGSSSGGSSGGGSSSGGSSGGGSSSGGSSGGGGGGASGSKKPESTSKKPETDKNENDKLNTEKDKIETTKNENTTIEENKLVSMVNLANVNNQEKAKEFKDIKDNYWAKAHIDKLSKAGVIDNTKDNFSPNEKINREDVVVMLVKLLGLKTENKNVFTDVDANSENAPYIATAYEVGIVNGNNGMFNPKADISRQDAMVMTARILKKLGVPVNKDTAILDQFKDMKKISNYAVEDVAILVNLGIINGNNGNMNPKNSVSKVEMVTIVSRLYDILQSKF